MSDIEPQPPAATEADTVEAYVRFALDHSGMSRWLKDALTGAMERDAIAVLNDLEILCVITRLRVGLKP